MECRQYRGLSNPQLAHVPQSKRFISWIYATNRPCINESALICPSLLTCGNAPHGIEHENTHKQKRSIIQVSSLWHPRKNRRSIVCVVSTAVEWMAPTAGKCPRAGAARPNIILRVPRSTYNPTKYNLQQKGNRPTKYFSYKALGREKRN